MTGLTRHWALVAIVALTAAPGAVWGDVKPEDVEFLPNVEKIIQNKGMKRAAALQHYWFNGQENQLVGKQEDGKGTKKPLSISDETITMDWVLSFPRAKHKHDELVKAVANDAAKKELAELLQKKFKKAKEKTISFGDFSAKGRGLYAQHTNSRPITYRDAFTESAPWNVDKLRDQLQDELQFALGAFNLFIIPKGKATLTPKKGIVVTISEVGVFVFDSYDFNGDQDLAWWKMPDKVSLVQPWPVPGYVNVTNEHYREYRKRHNRGGDFLIYTDVKVTKAEHRFTLPAGAVGKVEDELKENPKKGKDEKKGKGERNEPPPKPKVVKMASPNKNSRGGAKIDTIVLHHTAGTGSAKDVGRQFRNPKAEVSSHYIVGKKGGIVQSVEDKDRAFHAGESAFKGRKDVNDFSIGIEIVNKGDGKDPFTDEQYEALGKLVAYLQGKYDIPRDRITGHKDVALPKGRKNDPAENFSYKRLFQEVEKAGGGKADRKEKPDRKGKPDRKR